MGFCSICNVMSWFLFMSLCDFSWLGFLHKLLSLILLRISMLWAYKTIYIDFSYFTYTNITNTSQTQCNKNQHYQAITKSTLPNHYKLKIQPNQAINNIKQTQPTNAHNHSSKNLNQNSNFNQTCCTNWTNPITTTKWS